jgi:hypothetical protein
MVTLQPQYMPSVADGSSRLQQQPALTANGSCSELMTSSPRAGDPEHSLFAINKTSSSGNSSSSSNASSYVLCSAAAGQAVEPVMQPAVSHVASSSRTAVSML